MSSSRDALRFTTLVPALEEQLAQARPDGLVGLGTVAELQGQLARILQVAESLNQPDRIARIKALQQRLVDIEAQAVLQYGADAHDPSMEMVVSMRVPSQPSSPKPQNTDSPSRAAIAGALALTVCTAGLAAPWYISLRRKRTASKAPPVQPSTPTAATPTATPTPSPNPTPSPSPAVVSDEPSIDCPVCFETVLQSNSCGLLNCTHRSCRACFVEYFSVKIRDGQVGEDELVCPDPSCTVAAHAYELESVLPEDTFTKYSDFLVLRGLQNDADTCWCPNVQCGEAIVAPRNQPNISCPACSQSFCKLCKISPWHASQTCEEAKKKAAAASSSEEDGLVIWMREQGTKVKLCPGCKEAIEKNSGCNHMTCSRCSHQFCWLCGQSFESSHFSSGPCGGLQFAAGDSLIEAIGLRDGTITNDSPIRPSPRVRMPSPEIQCGMRFEIPDIEPILDIMPTIACGMRPTWLDEPVRCRMSIRLEEQVDCGMRHPDFDLNISVSPDRPEEQIDCEMCPPDLSVLADSPDRLLEDLPSATPVTIACGMRHPDFDLNIPHIPISIDQLQPQPEPVVLAPVGTPSDVPPPPPPPDSSPEIRRPTKRCGKRAPNPKPKEKKEKPKIKVPVKRCGKRAPPKKVSPSSVSSPTSWSVAERQRIFDTCKMMLEMLETIEDSFSSFFEDRQFLRAAWHRFEQWMQLLHKNRTDSRRLLPPLDVAFIWHAYMIRTEIYVQDLPRLLNIEPEEVQGLSVPWKCAGSASVEEDRQLSVRMWNSAVVNSSYDSWTEFVPGSSASTSSSAPSSSSSSSSSDSDDLPYQLRMSFLLEDLKWIRDLRRGWPRFMSNRCDFLNDTMEAYFDWVHRTYSATTHASLKGPPVDIDAFWHSHMLDPSAYKRDVESRYGAGCAIWHRPLADGVHDESTL